MSKSKGFALSEAIATTLANRLASVSDQTAAMVSLQEYFVTQLGKIKGLKGKPLPKADVERVTDKLQAEYAKRVEAGTVKDTSVKSMVSTAAKVARCAPVLAAMDAEQYREHCRNWSDTRTFCTALQNAKFVIKDAIATASVAKAADPIKLTVRSYKAILGVKGSKHKAHCKGAKAVLALLAMRCNLNMGKLGEEYFSREEAIKFLGL